MAGLLGKRFIEDVRAAMPVLTWAQRRGVVKRVGNEFAFVDNPSLKIDPRKNVWGDFGSGDNIGGDVFKLEMYLSQCEFTEAVRTIAQVAGIREPAEPRSNGGGKAPEGEPPGQEEPPPHPGPRWDGNGGGGRAEALEVTAVYDYGDGEGGLLYQVCRREGFRDGKRVKSFFQRRKHDGAWVNGIVGGPYMQGHNGEWYVATKERLGDPRWRERPTIVLDEVAHALYRLAELLAELREAPAEQRPIYVPEGEKDCETLAGWGLLATTNSGGAGQWRSWHAEQLRDADVVVLLDNDKAGRQRGSAIAASLRPLAKRVRVLSWPDHWKGCPEGGDVTDWVEHGGGNLEAFERIVDGLKDWSPEMPVSSFGAIRFADIDKQAKELKWLIKGVLTRGEVSIWFGQYGSGKSFLITDAALAIARAVPWMGLRTHPGLVIYQAGEGGLGFRRRLKAYRQVHYIKAGEDLPFVLLPSRIDAFSSDDDMLRLIAEIKGWAAFYDVPLELVVIDTFNSAAPGADENSSRDMGPVLVRCRKIAEECCCHVALVDHTPKEGGSPRGWSGKMGNIDQAVMIWDTGAHRDGRPVRQWKLAKQKDGATDLSRQFVLRSVVIGEDDDKDPITSCVVTPLDVEVSPTRGREKPEGWAELHPANELVFRCLVQALKKLARVPPKDAEVPAGVHAITVRDWQNEFQAFHVGLEELTPTVRERLRGKIRRAVVDWMPDKVRLIDKKGEWIWRTDRKVWGVDWVPKRVEAEADPILAPGDSLEDVMDPLWQPRDR
jgi:hypothetical protein